MKFMILMSDLEGVWDALSEAEQDRVVKEHGEFERALRAEAKFVCSYRLAHPPEARTVRLGAGGQIQRQAGPFTSGHESLGGVYVIEAESMDEALQWAERSRFIPGANEVRPLYEG